MKPACFLTALSAVTVAIVRSRALRLEPRTNGDYVQMGQGNATFTVYTGCSTPGKHRKLCFI